jgi:TRAP-type C4-dicarboxylate transport system permease small subunit
MSKQPARVVSGENRPASRLERVLSGMVLSTIGLSILCFLLVIAGTSIWHIDPGTGVWPIIIALPLVGLPIGFVLIITLIVINMRARRREAQGGSR